MTKSNYPDHEVLKSLGFESYHDYLENSFYWHAFRQRYIRNECCACNKWGYERTMQLHHITYERLGGERPEDVRTLCEFCHKQSHVLIDKGEATLALAHVIIRERHLAVDQQLSFNFEDTCAAPAPQHQAESEDAWIEALFDDPFSKPKRAA